MNTLNFQLPDITELNCIIDKNNLLIDTWSIESQTINLFDNKPIKKIYHFADIHIRRSEERYQEYYDVFENVYSILKTKDMSNSLIVICGDILHEKKGYSKESLQLTFNFFNNLRLFSPVIVIMGNHDGLINNNSNYDQLDVIINQVNTTKFHQQNANNVYYFKYSGIYSVNNIDFAVSSCFDKKKMPSFKISRKSENHKIALYHGMVKGDNINCNEFVANKYSRNLLDFVGFDYVFLGDIHKFQYLNNEKTVAYSGSLIQQNISEDYGNHGFIEWDLVNKQSNFIAVNNKFGFVKLEVSNNNIQQNLVLPTHAIIAITLIDSQKLVIQEKIAKYLENCETSTLIWKEEKKKKNNSKEDNIFNGEELKLDDQNVLIKKYCIENGESNDDAELMVEINKRISSKIKESTKYESSNISWKLISLKFENLFSYGAGNHIDFTKYDGNVIVGIIGPNHYGKSSIIDILLFVLFDKCSRKIKKHEIMNINKNNSYCECIIECNKYYYKIIKKQARNKKGITSEIHLLKLKKTINTNPINGNNEWNNISLENVLDASNQIKDIVGSYDNFIKCNISLQDGENFIHLKGSDKIEYLKDVTSLNLFNDMESVAKEEKKELTIAIKTLEKQIGTQNVGLLKKNIERANYAYSNVKLNTKKLKDEKRCLTEKIQKLQSQKVSIPSSMILVNEIEIDDLENKIGDYSAKKRTLSNKYNECTNKIKEILEPLKVMPNNDNIPNDVLVSSHININEVKKKKLQAEIFNMQKNIVNISNNVQSVSTLIHTKNNLEQQIISNGELLSKYNDRVIKLSNLLVNVSEQTIFDKKKLIEKRKTNTALNIYLNQLLVKLKVQEKTVKQFDNFEYDTNCKFCLNNPFTKDALTKKDSLAKLNNKVNITQTKINLSTSELNEAEKEYLKYKKLKNQKKKNIETNNKISKTEQLIKNINHSIELHKIQIDTINEKIKLSNECTELKIKNNKINTEIDKINEEILLLSRSNNEYMNYYTYKSELDTIKHEIFVIDSSISHTNDAIKKLKDKIESQKDLIIIQEKNNQIDIDTALLVNIRQLIIVKIKDSVSNEFVQKSNIVKLEAEINSYNKINNEIKLCTEKLNNIQKYLKIVDKKGLPFNLLSGIIKQIEQTTNQYLEIITDFSVSIKDSGSKSGINRIKSPKTSIDIYKITKTSKLNISSCSGFEKFIIGFTLRLALIDVCNKNKPNFIAIDEGFSCMDDNNLSNINSLLQLIRQKFDFTLLVSHIDIMKDHCEKHIHINKKNLDSDSYIQ